MARRDHTDHLHAHCPSRSLRGEEPSPPDSQRWRACAGSVSPAFRAWKRRAGTRCPDGANRQLSRARPCAGVPGRSQGRLRRAGPSASGEGGQPPAGLAIRSRWSHSDRGSSNSRDPISSAARNSARKVGSPIHRYSSSSLASRMIDPVRGLRSRRTPGTAGHDRRQPVIGCAAGARAGKSSRSAPTDRRRRAFR